MTLLSPEALLRQSIRYSWPSSQEFAHYIENSQYCPDSHNKATDLFLLPWIPPNPWTTVSWKYLLMLRTHRYKLCPVHDHGSECVGFCRQDILHLANRGGFFKKGTPPLEAAVDRMKLGTYGCVFVAFELVGPVGGGPLERIEPKQRPDGDWNDCRKCLCLVFLLPPGELHPDQWSDKEPLPHSEPDLLLPDIFSCSENRQTNLAVVTDGTSTLLLRLSPPREWSPSELFRAEVENVSEEPLPLCLTSLIYLEAISSGLWGMSSISPPEICLGALNNPSTPLPQIEAVLEREAFCDFDVYTMQRDSRYWEQFIVWKSCKLEEAEKQPLCSGDVLVAEKDGFARRFTLLRSPILMPAIPLETTKRVLSRIRILDAIAEKATRGSNGTFNFRIMEQIRVRRDTYSQVVSGVIEHDGVVSGPLCLKLYDERLFPVPFYEPSEYDAFSWLGNGEAYNRLLTWNAAEDLARREEAAYDRLREYQGSLIPYCYGFHFFILPNGHRCIGFIMEKVEGVPLDKINFDAMDIDAQKEFVLEVRHGLRVLRYAQIQQTDWHMDQFIIRPYPSQKDRYEVVFIDFAFALQHADALFTPASDDWQYCKNRLWDVMDENIVNEVWFPQDENEY